MALYEVVLTQKFANQECINRWNYVSSGAAGSASAAYALVDAMGFIPHGVIPGYPTDAMFSAIGTMQSQDVFYTQVLAKNIYDPTDFYDLPFPPTTRGQNTGVSQSPVDSWGFFSNRTRLDIHRATKRFVGVTQDDVGTQGVFVSSGAALMTEVALYMGNVLAYSDGGASLSFAPCVVGKQKYTTPSARTAYRYYPDLATQTDHLMLGVTWIQYNNVRSQTSRQVGRGS